MKIRYLVFLLTVLSPPCLAQPPDTAAKYNAETAKCREQIKKEDYSGADVSCKSAIALAFALPAEKKAERLAAYENYGLVFYFQEEYEKAIDNFLEALEFGKSLPAGSPAVGNVYFNLGRSNQKMEELDRAEEYFLAAEDTYRKAYSNTSSRKLKKDYKDYIGILLVLRSVIAGQTGDVQKQKEIQKAIKSLSKM